MTHILIYGIIYLHEAGKIKLLIVHFETSFSYLYIKDVIYLYFVHMTIECVTNGSNVSCLISECANNSNILNLPLLEVLSSDTESSTKLVYIITVNILVAISIVNNLLCLQTFLCSQKICTTNIGTYLIGFTFTNLVCTILMELEFYLNIQPAIHYNRRTILNDIMIHLGLCLSSFIAAERACIEYLHQSLYASRKRALTVTVLFTLFIMLTKLPTFLGRRTSSGNDLTPFSLHFLSSLAVLYHISRHRIYILNIRKRDYCSILCQQLDKHRDFFLPSFIIYILCNIRYHIWTEGIYKCSLNQTTSIRVYAALLIIVNIYYTFTFLIYVYPSRVYFAEFKRTSVIGKCLKRLQR